MFDLQELFPSVDGNEKKRKEFLSHLESLLEKIDQLKDESRLSLGKIPIYSEDYYNQKIKLANVPHKGLSIEETIGELINLLQGQRIINSRYLMNATPLPNIASLLGNFVMALINGNNIWDVDGSSGANAEVQVVSSLSKIVGYDATISGGYTTWGGQGAVFNSLRLAIARRFPHSNKEGIPTNLYVFSSELAHFSLFKSAEASGIGTNHLIKIRANSDDSMDVGDLYEKMVEVVRNGGIPLYVVATMGTTDSFGIDDIQAVKQVLTRIESEYNLEPIYLHADSAMGGMYTFFNDYNFDSNPLNFDNELISILESYQEKFKSISLADSMVFDFHKLGQTPYITSLFLVKDKSIFTYVDIEPDETPYIGNKGFGSYHTSYTLECSRMGSAITIFSSLLALGVEGYQKILANYLMVNRAFREALKAEFSDVSITNNISPVTTFRFYDNHLHWGIESSGEMAEEDIIATNDFNNRLSECFGKNRETVYFGSTSKQRTVTSSDTEKQLPVFVHKFYSVSPYTTLNEIPIYIDFLKVHKNSVERVPVL